MGQRSLSIQQNGIGNTPNTAPPVDGEDFIHLFGDQLGTQRITTNNSGQVLQRAVLTPYGDLNSLLDGNGQPKSTSSTPFLFTGHRFDDEADLHYMGARYYDPLVGRFLSTDPELIGPGPGVTFRRIGGGAVNASAYAYAMNRPTGLVDPKGRWVETAWDAANVAWGAKSFRENAAAENWGAAALDALGVIVDSAAAILPGVPGGAGAALKVARTGDDVADLVRGADKAADAAKGVDGAGEAANQAGAATRGGGKVYRVEGDKTQSGKPYIGRTGQSKPEARGNRDGRDRSGAKTVDTYDKNSPREGARAEQKAMNKAGGVDKLDNKRNEISPAKWEENGIEPPPYPF